MPCLVARAIGTDGFIALALRQGAEGGEALQADGRLSGRALAEQGHLSRAGAYARLARLVSTEEVDAFAEELEDRFGPPPDEAQAFLDLARIQALAVAARVAKVDAGPKAIALTPAPGVSAGELATAGLEPSGERLLWHGEVPEGRDRAQTIIGLLEGLA